MQASTKLIELPNDVTPKGIPAKVATTIPIRIAPFTFKITNSKVTTSPIKNTISCGWLKVVKAGTPLEKLIKPTFNKPKYATNTPIPPPIAFCKLWGIDLTICFLILVTVITILITPQINTIDSACCQLKPKVKHTVYTKKAFRPIPGAWAYGTLATKPITKVPMILEIMVAKNTAPHSIPDWDKIAGLTAII